jgi:FMN phosphatase YigB (HAD superfamily)
VSVRTPHEPRIRAVLFDVDGTLYHQAPLRAAMALELAAHAASGRLGFPARRVARALSLFRTVREELRAIRPPAATPLSRLQFEEPARRLGESPTFIQIVVDEWMFRRPVKYLRYARRGDVMSLIGGLLQRGVKLGVFSDYPAHDKLHGLGLSDPFSLVLCATDPEIDAFKPHPRGFLHACRRWGLDPAEVAYVGDRADVDLAGAEAAGMPGYLVGRPLKALLSHIQEEDCHGTREFKSFRRRSRPTA